MASEVGVSTTAADSVAEEVEARTRDLVRGLLRPGGPVGVEAAANAAGSGARRQVAKMSRDYALRREDVEAVAVGAASAALTIIVHSQNGSLNLPRSQVEAEIAKAVAAAGVQMASEVGLPAATAEEEAAARAKDLVRSLLRPGGPVDVEAAANAAAKSARCAVAVVARENAEPVHPEVIEAAAVAAAMVLLRTLVRSQKGSLNLPRDMVEAGIAEAIGTATAQANNSALIYLVLAFAVGVALLAEFVCLWCR